MNSKTATSNGLGGRKTHWKTIVVLFAFAGVLCALWPTMLYPHVFQPLLREFYRILDKTEYTGTRSANSKSSQGPHDGNIWWQLWEQYKVAKSRGYFSMLMPFLTLIIILIAVAMCFRVYNSRRTDREKEENYQKALKDYSVLQDRLIVMQNMLQKWLQDEEKSRADSKEFQNTTNILQNIAKEAREGLEAIKNTEGIDRQSKSLVDVEAFLNNIAKTLDEVVQCNALAASAVNGQSSKSEDVNGCSSTEDDDDSE